MVLIAASWWFWRGSAGTRGELSSSAAVGAAPIPVARTNRNSGPVAPSFQAADAGAPVPTSATGAGGLAANGAAASGTAAGDGQLSPSAAAEIQALQREKASLSVAQQKMDSQLVFALKRSRNEPIAGGAVPDLKIGAAADADGRILVDIAANSTANLLGQIRAVGGTVEDSLPLVSPVRATVPLNRLEDLALLPEVKFIRPAVLPMHNNSDPEGVVVHRDFAARTNFYVDGTGVKVGVLSSSVDYLAQAQSNGNLGTVTVLPGQSGVPGSGEGTAMLEIVHAMAPGAQLFFATGGPTEKQFATNILNLRFAYGCDIIVDDVAFYDESPFQDMVVAQAVNAVAASGALYFSSAVNSGNLDSAASGTWEGDFKSGGVVSSPTNGLIHNFAPSGSPTNYDYITGTNSEQGPTVLFWSDPLGASTNDYDLFVLDSTGTHVVSASVNPQTGSQDPVEGVPPPAIGQRLVVVLASGTNRYLHIDTIRGKLGFATAGSTRGHNAATNAVGVAAVSAADAYPFAFAGGAGDPVESFSSDGPRRMYFFPDGTPMTPGDYSSSGGQVIQQPLLAAADGVTTDVPGGFAPFFGTSAAAPHAAAIAALVKSYNPALTAAQIRSNLTGTALDIMAAGLDRDSGYGIAMPYLALQAAVAPPPVITVVTPAGAAVGRQVFVTGSSFRTATNVQFQGVPAAFSVVSNSLVIATVPAGAATGPLTITTPFGAASVAFTVLPPPVPADDNFANAQSVAGNFFIVTTNTGGAGKETGEPNHAGNSGGHSVWYRWIAPASGAYAVDTVGSDFVTLLAVYTGVNVSNLTLVASNLNAGSNGASALTFNATSNTTYQIAVDGFNGASGNVTLRLLPATNTIFSTAFEPAEGYVFGAALAGQNGWTTNSTGNGANGVVSNYFAGQGQQAYLGFSSPTPASNTFLYRPFNYTMDTNTRPVVQFSTSMAIADSTDFSYDQFWWIVKNASGHSLFGLEFDNFSKYVAYELDSGSPAAGLPYASSTIYTVSVTMDFGRNLWSATLNGSPITIFAQPITTTNAALTLGDIDAVWVINNSASPGNNYLLFDNYTVTAGPSLVPKILAGPQNQTVSAGSDIAFTVAAEGSPPMTYQWSFNSGAIAGATNSALILRSVTSGQTGTYSVAVNNAGGGANASASLTVTNPPPGSTLGSVGWMGADGLALNVSLALGNSYRLLASTNFTDWTTIGSFYGYGSNTLCFDPLATNFSRRFYRLASP